MRKLLVYSFLAVGLFSLVGVSVASAHGWFGRFSDVTSEEFAQRQEAMFQEKANLLGIDVGQVKEACAEVKTLKEIAEEYGITQEQIQERMKAARQERLQTQLQAMADNGIISQDQANQRLQFMENRFENGKMGDCSRRGFARGLGW